MEGLYMEGAAEFLICASKIWGRGHGKKYWDVFKGIQDIKLDKRELIDIGVVLQYNNTLARTLMILCWVSEKLYNVLQTEKEPQDQEMKWAT